MRGSERGGQPDYCYKSNSDDNGVSKAKLSPPFGLSLSLQCYSDSPDSHLFLAVLVFTEYNYT